jgi:hypothetical protein
MTGESTQDSKVISTPDTDEGSNKEGDTRIELETFPSRTEKVEASPFPINGENKVGCGVSKRGTNPKLAGKERRSGATEENGIKEQSRFDVSDGETVSNSSNLQILNVEQKRSEVLLGATV